MSEVCDRSRLSSIVSIIVGVSGGEISISLTVRGIIEFSFSSKGRLDVLSSPGCRIEFGLVPSKETDFVKVDGVRIIPVVGRDVG